MKRLSIVLAVASIAVAALIPGGVYAGTGNGAPPGAHFTLNIIGVSNPKNLNPSWDSGSRIFVLLNGTTKINLCESGTTAPCAASGFYVVDANGTDGSATFALPVPSQEAGGTCTTNCVNISTDYSIFVRSLTGGEAFMKLCGVDPLDTTVVVCNAGSNVLDLKKDTPPKFQNVTAQLLFLFDVTVNGVFYSRIQLFDPVLQGYFWNYDNHGLKLAQLRFYDCSTLVGTTGFLSSSCGLTGK